MVGPVGQGIFSSSQTIFRRISINFLLFYASNKKPLNLNLIEDILYQKVYH